MGAASGKLFAEDRGAAGSTWMPGPSIHPCLASVVAIHSFKITEIAEGGAPGSDTDLKHVHQSLTKHLKLLFFKTSSRSEGHDARSVEALIGINVSNSSYESLVEKCCFNRPAAPLEPLLQIRAGEG